MGDRQSQNGEIGNNIEQSIGHPKGPRIDAVQVFNRFVPEARDRSALEYCRNNVCETGRDDESIGRIASPAEPLLDGENAVIETQDGDFVEGDDYFVHDLRAEEPLYQLKRIRRKKGMEGSLVSDLQGDDYFVRRDSFGSPPITIDHSFILVSHQGFLERAF